MTKKILSCFLHSATVLGFESKKLKSHRTVSRCEYTDCDTFNYKSIAIPMKDIIASPFNNESWNDIMDIRALELLKLNKPTFVMWSGGIDSTGALVAILKNWPKDDLKKLTVLCNAYSIKEYPEFFRDFVSKIQYEVVDVKLEQYCKRGILVTGELGDRIAMDMHTRDLKDNGFLRERNWKDCVVKLHGTEFLDKFLPIADEYPGTIETVEQFYHWFTISQQWQCDMLRLLGPMGSFVEPENTLSEIHHFYNTPLFQQWAIRNTDTVISKFEQDDKWIKFVPKMYIYEFTKHDYYMYNKVKVWSLQNISRHNRLHAGLTEDFKFINEEEVKEYIK